MLALPVVGLDTLYQKAGNVSHSALYHVSGLSDLIGIFFRDNKVSFEMLHFYGAETRPLFDEDAQKSILMHMCKCSVLVQFVYASSFECGISHM